MLLQRLALRAALACLMAASTPACAQLAGRASFYGYESGRVRADGYSFDPMEFRAAHWTLPLCGVGPTRQAAADRSGWPNGYLPMRLDMSRDSRS